MTCLYLVSSRHFSQTSEPFSITSCFLQEIFLALHPQPPQASIWELLLSAACSALLLAYLLLAQKGHWQLLINLQHTHLPKTSAGSALLPLPYSVLIVGGASFAVWNLLSLKFAAQLINAYWVAASRFSWTLIWRTEQFEFGVLCYPPSF